MLRKTRVAIYRHPVAFWMAVGFALAFGVLAHGAHIVGRNHPLLHVFADVMYPELSQVVQKRFGVVPVQGPVGQRIIQFNMPQPESNRNPPELPYFIVADDRHVVAICLDAGGATSEGACLIYDRASNSHMRMVIRPWAWD